MANQLNDKQPIYVQIRNLLEDMIVKGQLKEGEQTPSTAQLSEFYKINHITVSKGVNQLVDEGILMKKRGLGVFVAEGAREKLLEKRRQAFVADFIRPLITEANSLNLNEDEVFQWIKQEMEQGEDA
ncbi:GntR family transcriptional regulator [Fundicoccus culcitae]|uniref:GntR family transcriptional regulator n=1 Tax=Fundicoccus culcitae TaxID=2969821 RepID=A0ABY5P8K1_9LACT|nr:GntR family transcriptional regulator [Fundicoccus culcitae]UUX34695.1 GntR family transcriptional regulator [Fundicoccus culcitae]